MKTLVFFLLLSSAPIGVLRAADGPAAMTPAKFQEIVSAPGDTAPLLPQLSAVPFWTNAVISNVMTYASGKVVREKLKLNAHTVGGKYVVFTLQSKFYSQPVHAILAYDAKASVLKNYGLYGDGHGGSVVTEGTVIYDYNKKIYTITSSNADFKETTTGSYTAAEDSAKTMVYKNGVLLMMRETKTFPVASGK